MQYQLKGECDKFVSAGDPKGLGRRRKGREKRQQRRETRRRTFVVVAGWLAADDLSFQSQQSVPPLVNTETGGEEEQRVCV